MPQSVLDPAFTLLVFKTVLTAGLAGWSLVAASNNVVGFRSASAAIRQTASMGPFQENPPIDSPLLRRAVQNKNFAPMALVLVLLLQMAAATLLLIGAAFLAAAIFTIQPPDAGVGAATLGLTALCAAWLVMLIGGLWFGYWIRQSDLQLTQVCLLTLTVCTALVLHF